MHQRGGSVAHPHGGGYRINTGAGFAHSAVHRRQFRRGHGHAPAHGGAGRSNCQHRVAVVNHQQLQIAAQRGFSGGGICHLGFDPVTQDAQDGREAIAVANYLTDCFINAFTGALHFFQESAAALNCCALIAQLGESARKSSMAIAKRCGIRNVNVNIGLKASRLVQCHHAAHHVLIARGALRVKLNDERLTSTLNASELLFQSALTLVDRGKMRSSAGDFTIGGDGLLAQAICRQASLLRGFSGSSTRIGCGHHAALSFIRCLGCAGNALSGVVNLRSEFSDACLKFSQAHRIGSGLFAHFTQPATCQLHSLGGLLLGAERLNAALLQRTLCVLRCLAHAFHFITTVFKERNGA